jgi:hypothetical protein
MPEVWVASSSSTSRRISINPSLLHLALHKETQGKFEEALEIVNRLINDARPNPFPSYCFLIENRAYTDSSNYLIEYREQLKRRLSEPPVLSNQGVEFDFQ